ncbi:AraC family transcriptional regulator [Paenibacillus sp. FSL M7-1046]|uniref:AraC family transcriptional regulator n=1 Tax=Paenibacillus sp. FSL M7-1046 TaxID=2975315 RepID=UPI0030FAD9F4
MLNQNKNIVNKPYIPLDNLSCKLREIIHIKCSPNEWEIKLQFIESHQLLIAASGQGWLNVDGQFIEMREGNMYVCTPGQLIQAVAHSFDERGFYYLRFDVIEDDKSTVDPMQMVKRDSVFPVKGEVAASSPVSVNALCESICNFFQSEDQLERFRSHILFQELLYHILQDAHVVQAKDSDAALEYVKTYIEQHYQEELSIEQLAKVAGVSSRHFMRLFKKRYGCSAIDYLAAFRITQAQQLMRTGGEYRLKDIARHVGYPDDLYFRRKFKQISGLPPAAFMRNSKQKIAAYHGSSIGQLLPLQVTPRAAPSDHPWTNYYQRKYQTDLVLPLSTDHSLKRDELKLAKPDFIIGIDSFVSAEEQTRIRQIAPAFFVPWIDNDWRGHLRLIAQFLDKTAIAETWLGNYERKAHFVREQIKNTIGEESLLILRITGDRYHVLGCRSLDAVFYDDLHLVPARGVDRMNPIQQLTPDELTDFCPDRILLILDEDPLSQSSWRDLMRSASWRELKAVRNGHVDFLPTYPWIEYTAFTHELILDEALKLWRNRA